MSVSLLDLPVQAPPLGALAAALREARVADLPRPPALRSTDALASLFEAELRLGIEAVDADRATEAASALWRRTGDLLRCHRTIARTLSEAGAAWAAGTCSVRVEHRMSATAGQVIARLRAHTPAPATDAAPVVLAVPPGERHTLSLDALAHLLEAAGHVVDLVGELPAGELVAAARGARAVVLSVHTANDGLPALVRALRAANPQALLVAGGAGARHSGADVLTDEPDRLLALLRSERCPLSEREREVLRCVADGLTNAEAAEVLGVTPATLKTHLDHVFDKTGASGRAAAVATGLRRGWIS
jgi:DNA-binding CsgD family transcriptional regulator/methylmalonyl-CoA mutase cobalamin-binding subunit